MKYILFAWTAYGQEGGWNDFIGLFDTVEEAITSFSEGFIPEYAKHLPHSQLSEYQEYWDKGQIVNATSLQVEKELEI